MSEDINKRLLNFEKELKEFHNKDYIKVEEKKVEEEKVLGIKELQEKLDKKNRLVEDNSVNSGNQFGRVAYAIFLGQFAYYLIIGFGALIFLK